MIDEGKISAFLAELASKAPPMPSPEAIKAIQTRHAGDIWPLSECSCCGAVAYGWRMGCTERDCRDTRSSGLRWRWAASYGPLGGGKWQAMTLDTDFCFINERD